MNIWLLHQSKEQNKKDLSSGTMSETLSLVEFVVGSNATGSNLGVGRATK